MSIFIRNRTFALENIPNDDEREGWSGVKGLIKVGLSVLQRFPITIHRPPSPLFSFFFYPFPLFSLLISSLLLPDRRGDRQYLYIASTDLSFTHWHIDTPSIIVTCSRPGGKCSHSHSQRVPDKWDPEVSLWTDQTSGRLVLFTQPKAEVQFLFPDCLYEENCGRKIYALEELVYYERGTEQRTERKMGCGNFEMYGKDQLCKAVLSSPAKIASLSLRFSSSLSHPFLSRNVVIQISTIICSLPCIVSSFVFCITLSSRIITIIFFKNWNYFFSTTISLDDIYFQSF